MFSLQQRAGSESCIWIRGLWTFAATAASVLLGGVKFLAKLKFYAVFRLAVGDRGAERRRASARYLIGQGPSKEPTMGQQQQSNPGQGGQQGGQQQKPGQQTQNPGQGGQHGGQQKPGQGGQR